MRSYIWSVYFVSFLILNAAPLFNAWAIVPGPMPSSEQLLSPADIAQQYAFGDQIDVDGSTAVIGATGAVDNFGLITGAAYIFQNTSNGWIETAKLLPSSRFNFMGFGSSVLIKGDTVIIGAKSDPTMSDGTYGLGAVYIFRQVGAQWIETAKLLPIQTPITEDFGTSLSLQGDILAVGAPSVAEEGSIILPGSVYLFQRGPTGWIFLQRIVPVDPPSTGGFGYTVLLGQGSLFIASIGDDDLGPQRGAVYRFVKSGSNWIQVDKILPDYTQSTFFGARLSLLGSDGLAISAPYVSGAPGEVVFYKKNVAGAYLVSDIISAPDGSAQDHFGSAMDSYGGKLLIGAWRAPLPQWPLQGKAYIFERQGNNLVHKETIEPFMGIGSNFAFSVALSCPYAFFGIYLSNIYAFYGGAVGVKALSFACH